MSYTFNNYKTEVVRFTVIIMTIITSNPNCSRTISGLSFFYCFECVKHFICTSLSFPMYSLSWKHANFEGNAVTLTFDLDLFQGQRSLITFRLVLFLYDKTFTSFKFLRKNYKVSRAITLLRFIEYAVQKCSVFS
jgi:hypothetical protein